MNTFLLDHNSEFNCLALSNDGKTLITGSSDNCVRIWDTSTKSQVSVLINHKNSVVCIEISNNDLLFASGSTDKTIILWEMHSKSSIFLYQGHSGKITAIAFSPDSKYLISGCSDKEILLWTTDSKEYKKKIVVLYPAACVVFTSKNSFFLAIGQQLHHWKTIEFESLVKTQSQISFFCSIALSKDENLVLVGCWNGMIIVFNSDTLSIYKLLKSNNGFVRSISVTDNGNNFVSGSGDGSIIIWNMIKFSVIHKFSIHSDKVNGVKCYNDLIFSVSSDKTIGISQISSKSFIEHWSRKPFNYGTLCIKDKIYAYGDKSNVIVSNFDDDLKFNFDEHINYVNKVSISRNKKYLVSSSRGVYFYLIVWDLISKLKVFSHEGYKANVNCLDVSNYGNFCLSGDDIGTFIVWNLDEKNIHFQFNSKSMLVSTKIVDGERFAVTVGMDSFVFVWKIRLNT